MLDEVGQAAEARRGLARHRGQALGEAADREDPGRRLQPRELGRVATVDEDELVRPGEPVRGEERLGVGRRDAGGDPVRGPRQRRQVGEAPVLEPGRRPAELGEARDGLLAQAGDALGLASGAPCGVGRELGLVALEIGDGGGGGNGRGLAVRQPAGAPAVASSQA
jgi:hypothetical protein